MTASATTTDLAGLRELAGKPLGVSDWRSVGQADVDTFAEVTGDRQWIHVDPERASGGPFGSTVAHGFLTLSLCSAILEETIAVAGDGMQVNYGLDRVRFPAPVPAGGSIRGHVSLVSTKDVAGGVEAVLRVEIELAGGDKPVCVADVVIRFYR